MQLGVQRPERYDSVAVALHWLLAVALIAQVALGFYLQEIPRNTPPRGWWVNLHKSTGLVLLALILVRIGWRLAHRPPPLPAIVSAAQRRLAAWGHAVLYVVMLALPLTGYVASNFSKWGVKFFNVIELPPWGPQDKRLYDLFNDAHQTLAIVFTLLVVAHVVAAVRHLALRDGVFARMWPRPTARRARAPDAV
jgi:cytochrome b561